MQRSKLVWAGWLWVLERLNPAVWGDHSPGEKHPERLKEKDIS